MVNFVQFVVGLAVAAVVAIILAFLTGVIHNRKGYVSIIEKKKKFHCIEIRKFSYYFPIIYRKVAYYPTIRGKKKINKEIVYYQVIDAMKLYESKKKIKDILLEDKNKKDLEDLYGIKIIK